ncbi:MAG: FtsX-like permease family protein [Spirochaetes bacterium]|nr:FtsX-like permease family protein [Spirochaetota bacterium]
MKEFVFLGLRTLRGRSGTGRYLRGAVAGIALGLVPLVVVMEVSTGMIEGITERLLEIGSHHLQASLPAALDMDDLVAAARVVEKLPDVRAATAERQATVLLAISTRSAGVTLRCVDPVSFARDEGLHRYLSASAGSLDLTRPRTVLISAALARTLGARLGDTVLAVAGLTGEAAVLPRVTRLTVGGIYETGYQELDKAVAYAALADAAAALPPRGARTILGVKVADPFRDLSTVASRVAEALGPDARVSTWRDLERSRLASFETTRWLLVLIMSLIVVVAAANVSSTVLMLVLERRQEIGILLGIGARPAVLTRSFLFAGLSAAVAGTALGIATGLLLAVNINGIIATLDRLLNFAAGVFDLARSPFTSGAGSGGRLTLFQSAYYLQSIPVRLRAFEVASAAAGTLLVACLAAWLPARRAGRLSPLELLRRS